MINESLTIETNRVLLRPLSEKDMDSFFQLAQDDGMWDYFALNLSYKDHLQKWMDAAFADQASGTRKAFTIIDKRTLEVAGSSSLLNIAYHDLRVEIGASWLGKKFRGTGLNRNAKYCLLRYAFEQLNVERVEFKTDVLNERAKKGLINVGGIEEGVFRSHMTMWNNRRRDSIYYSIIKKEWPVLKAGLFKDIKGYEFH